MPYDKSKLREEFLSKRKTLTSSFVSETSRKIVELITTTKEFQSAQIISCYYPFRNEVDILPLLGFAGNKKYVFPRVVKGIEKLDFYLINLPDDFEKGVFGLMEPKTFLPKVDVKDIDLFLVPGVAFTKSGCRLGYGGGYYDETLRDRKLDSLAFGVCFDIQLAENIPLEEWDIKMGFVVTESEIYKTH